MRLTRSENICPNALVFGGGQDGEQCPFGGKQEILLGSSEAFASFLPSAGFSPPSRFLLVRLDYCSFADPGTHFTSQGFRQTANRPLQIDQRLQPYGLLETDDDWQGLESRVPSQVGPDSADSIAVSKENLEKLWADSEVLYIHPNYVSLVLGQLQNLTPCLALATRTPMSTGQTAMHL